MLPSSCTDGKDKPITMILIRICRKHFVKLVLAIAVLYFIFALHFFGSPDSAENSERKTFSPKVTSLEHNLHKDNTQPKQPEKLCQKYKTIQRTSTRKKANFINTEISLHDNKASEIHALHK